MEAGTHQPELVTVVTAAKDEAPTIAEVVRRCLGFAGIVIVVDGHSEDGTVRLAKQAGASLVIQDNDRGKGAALRLAIRHVTTPVTVFIDADGSHVPEDIPRLVEPTLVNCAGHVSAAPLL